MVSLFCSKVLSNHADQLYLQYSMLDVRVVCHSTSLRIREQIKKEMI